MTYTPSTPNDYRGALYHAQSAAHASAFLAEQAKRDLRTLPPTATVGTTALAEALWPAEDRLASAEERLLLNRLFTLLNKLPSFEMAAWCEKGPEIQLYGKPARPWVWRAPASEPDKSTDVARESVKRAAAVAGSATSVGCLYDEPELDARLRGLSNAADTGAETVVVYRPRQLASDMRARMALRNVMVRDEDDEAYWSDIAATIMNAICDGGGLDEEQLAAAIVTALKKQEVAL